MTVSYNTSMLLLITKIYVTMGIEKIYLHQNRVIEASRKSEKNMKGERENSFR